MRAFKQMVAWLAPIGLGAIVAACSSGPAANSPNAAGATTAPGVGVVAAQATSVAAVKPGGASQPVAANGVLATSVARATESAATQTAQRMASATAAAISDASQAVAATATSDAYKALAAASATSFVEARARSVAATAAVISAAQTATAMPTATPVLPPVLTLATGQAPDTSGAVPLNLSDELLQLVRDAPDLATDDVLLPYVQQQIQRESTAWRAIDAWHKLQNAQSGGRFCPQGETTCRPTNPSPFVFEWQKLVEQQPQLAQGAFLDPFVRPDAQWSFVTQQPGWDESRYNAVGLFIFSRESIEGRQPDFAARELLPVFRRFITAAAARTPTNFWFDVPLARTEYDFPTSTFRFYPIDQTGQQSGPVDRLEILPVHNSPRELNDLPEAVRTMANYANGAGTPEQPAPLSQHVLNGAPAGVAIDSSPWQSALGGNYFLTAPALLSLNRDLQIPSLKMDSAKAEALVKKYAYVALTARVYISVDHALTYKSSTIPPRAGVPAATNMQSVLTGRVERVDLFAGARPQPGYGAGSSQDLVATFN